VSLLAKAVAGAGRLAAKNPDRALSIAKPIKGLLSKAYSPALMGEPITNAVMPMGYNALGTLRDFVKRHPSFKSVYAWSRKNKLPPYAHPTKGREFLREYGQAVGWDGTDQELLEFFLNRNVPYRQGFGLRTQQALENINFPGIPGHGKYTKGAKGVKGYNPGLVYRAPGGVEGFKKTRTIQFNDPKYYTNSQWTQLNESQKYAVMQGQKKRLQAKQIMKQHTKGQAELGVAERDIKNIQRDLKLSTNPDDKLYLSDSLALAKERRVDAINTIRSRGYHPVMANFNSKNPHYMEDVWDFAHNKAGATSVTNRRSLIQDISNVKTTKDISGLLHKPQTTAELRDMVTRLLNPVTIKGPYDIL